MVVITAVAPYSRGDVIMRNKPWAYVLEEKHAASYCHYCFRRPVALKDEALKRCTQCLFAHYCGAKCAKAAWKDHKIECKKLQSLRESKSDIPECNIRLLARMITKLRRGERSDPPEACSPPTERTYDSLCTHADKINTSVIQITAFTFIVEKLVAFLGKENMPEDGEVLKDAYSKLIVNAMTLYDGSWPYGIGAALPLGATRFDHACKPNADYMIRDGCVIVITALTSIPSIEDVRICYCNAMEMTVQRQALLREHYYFTCQCEFCLDENRDNMMRSLRCPNSKCPGVIPNTVKFLPLPCTKCGRLLSGKDEYIRDAVELMGKINNQTASYTALFEQPSTPALIQQQKNALRDLEKLYEEVKNVLSPLNVFYLKLIVHLADHESTLGWKLHLEETDAYRYYHGFSSFLAVRLVLQGGYQVNSGLLDKAEESLREAETILQTTHGTDHPVYADMMDVKNVQIPQLRKMQKLANSMGAVPKSKQ